MRADGRPSAVAVAIVITSGASTTRPAASNQAANCSKGSPARSPLLSGWASSTCDILLSMAVTRTIDIRTGIPGPRSKEILDRKEQVVAEPLSIVLPVVGAAGHGATITAVDGTTFIDFTGGVGCLNVGHSHPRVVAAAQEQLERFAHTDFTIVPYEPYVELAERLSERAPISGPVKAAFFNAGTEAVENAVKFARAYTKRPAVIAFEGGFHGRTLM